jgi:hypothetical protein
MLMWAKLSMNSSQTPLSFFLNINYVGLMTLYMSNLFFFLISVVKLRTSSFVC